MSKETFIGQAKKLVYALFPAKHGKRNRAHRTQEQQEFLADLFPEKILDYP